MDSLDFTKAPSSFQSVKWISDALLLTMAGGWLTSYIATIRTAHGDNACWVPLLPVSCNLAWELVYATIYPPPRLPIVTAWFALNLVVVYTALKYAPDGDARGYSPLRGCRLYLAFVAATALWAAGHVALARVLGPLTAFYYGGLACQLMTSAAALCGLLDSGSSRGASWLIWSSRVIGTGSALAGVFFRAYYWPEVWAWTMNPLFYWAAAAFAVFDGAYGVCFWLVRRAEGRAGVKKE
ncbi:integral membrane protein [Aspergillus crustosus]